MIGRQSLLRRLLLAFTIVLLGIWLAIVRWDLHEMYPTQKKDTERELRGGAFRTLAIVGAIADRPEAIPGVVAKMANLHHTFYQHSFQWQIPRLEAQVWKGRALLYNSGPTALSPELLAAGPEGQPVPEGWVASVASDPDSDITVRLATEFFGQWAVLGFTSIGYYFNPLLLGLPFLLLPAWLVVRRGLRPLNAIVTEVEERSGSDLSPLRPSPYAELSPLTGSINRLMAQLTQRIEREQEFLVDAAHEIKTPLAIIQINAGALDSSPTPQLVEEAVAGLRHGVERAAHTVRQLVVLSQADFGAHQGDQLQLEPLDLAAMLRGQIASAMQIAAPRGIRIAYLGPENCVLALHRESMVSLIDNLVGNAVKYSPDGSSIDVRLEEQEQRVRLAVIDQGPGIAPALREKVFERFYRLPDQEEAGSGLGLAIAARAASRNRGVIRLETGNGGVGLAAVVELTPAGQGDASFPFAAAQSKPIFQRLRTACLSLAEKIGSMRNRSLFRRMLLGFMAVVASMWLCYLVWDVVDAKTFKVSGMQGDLQRSSKRIAIAMDALADRPEKIAPVVKKIEELHYAFYQQRGWYVPPLQTQVWKDGRLVYLGDDPRQPPTVAAAGPMHQPARSGWVAWIEPDPRAGTTVRMATELMADWFFNSASIAYFLKPLLVCLPLLLLLAAFAIGFGLRPLKAIVKEIEHRSASNLTPLAPSRYAELAPLVNSVNRLMERLAQRLAHEQEFLADAARELQAPLANIRTNLDALGHGQQPQSLAVVATGLRQAVEKAAHTVHQLLALSRSGSDRDKNGLPPIDLVALLRDRLALAMQLALPRDIRIALHSPESCVLPLHRESMAALIDNLVSNAVKHSPEKAKVAVSMRVVQNAPGQVVQVVVADKGPGIALELRDKVFERFYRLPGRHEGNGLGLAIAGRAAARNFGSIRMETGRNGIGLAVIVEFPLAPT